MEQVTIFRNKGRYGGWPANYGIWNWDDEIVVGFTAGYPDLQGGFHARDKSRPFETMQARSLDGGKSWSVIPFPGRIPGNRGLSADEHVNEGLKLEEALVSDPPSNSPGNINFTHPDFAMMCARTGLSSGTQSFFYTSYDRCHRWDGPYALPMFGQNGVQARTDIIVEGKNQCLLFLTVNKPTGREGWTLCARTSDGGNTFSPVSFVGSKSAGEDDFEIMPSSVKLKDGRLLSALRCRGGTRTNRQDRTWIDLYASDDHGATWQYVCRPIEFRELGHNGNPPSLHQLPDERLVLIYGNRDKPYTIGARLSHDFGNTWSEETTLRSDGGNYDIGYPRSVVLNDGTVVTVYYFNDQSDGNGERFIEATLWKP